MRLLCGKGFSVAILFALSLQSFAQPLDVATCAEMVKRSNGNGQANAAGGNFTPQSSQNNPVAPNITGTKYELVPFLPSTKTGDIHFKWYSLTPIVNIPVVSRVWLTAPGSTSATLSNIQFGPPVPISAAPPNYYVDYAFYSNNLPNTGKVTLEFSDPQTGVPTFRCSYDLQSNGPVSSPTIDCSPTITTQPVNKAVCGAASTSFSVVASGATGYQWQVSSDGSSFSNIISGGNYSNATSATLNINNPNTYDGKYYRVVLTGTGCPGTTSSIARLSAKPSPTAVFNANNSLCGTGARSLGIALTGTAPWSVTYSNGVSSTTVSNITSNPYYISVSPLATTAYAITSVSDTYCSNSSPSGNVIVTVHAAPTVTPTNASVCIGSSSFQLPYSSTGTPDQYTVTAGTRAMPGFVAISNATLSASPQTITIPTTGTTAGTYDFNIVVTNSTTGCVSASTTFTLIVNPLPVLSASVSSNSVCASKPITITAAPENLSGYSWIANPTASIASVYNPTVTPTANTTYTVFGTNSNGCTGTASVQVTVLAGPTLSITPASPTICNGASTLLTASGGIIYSWSPSPGLSATEGASVTASPTTTTSYTVTSQNSSGCASIGTVTVTVATPVLNITPSAITICRGTSASLAATAGFTTYSWVPTAGLSSANASTVTAGPDATTTYSAVATDASGCTAMASATVTVSPAQVNTALSVSNYYTFCSQGADFFTLPVNVVSAVTSMTWSYASEQAGPYTSFTGAVSPSGATFTPTTIGNTNATLNVTDYSKGGYRGPRYLRLVISEGSCSYNYDIQIFDTKGSGDALPTPIAAKTSICSGEATTLSLGSLNEVYPSFQWQSATALAGTYTNIPGATSSNYTTPALTANTFYRAVLNVTNGSCGTTTGATTINVANALTANTISPVTACTNGSSFITLTGSAITGGIYQWQHSTTSATGGFTDIVGAISKAYTLSSSVLPSTNWYRRIASTSTCATNNSTAVAVYSPLTNNFITNSTTSFCTTAQATTLMGSTPMGGDGVYVYAWQSSTDGTNFTTIAGAGAISYTTVSTTATSYYRRVVTSGSCGSSTSENFVITVNANPIVTITPSASTLCAGSSVILTASGADSYTWTGPDLSAATGGLVISTPTQTSTYTVTGTSVGGCSATSAMATITYVAPPAIPTISSSSVTICSTVSSYNLNSLISSGAGIEWYTAPTPGASYLVTTPAAVTQAGTYYAYSKTGSCYSTGNAGVTLKISNVSKPVVSSTSFSACAPATVNLASLEPIAATGTSLEWHTGNTSGSPLVATPLTAGAGTYYLFPYSTTGACYGPPADAVTVTINALPAATVSSSPAAVCYPNRVNLDSYNTTGNGTYTYQWHTVSSNPTPANLVSIPTTVSAGGNYYLYATSTTGCKGPASSALSVIINSKPTVHITAPAIVCAATVLGIATSTDADGPLYSWQSTSDAGVTYNTLSNTGIYKGTSAATLSISSSTGLDGYQFRNIVTRSAGCSTTSSNAIVTVDATTSIRLNPSDTNVLLNGTATFKIKTSGSPTVNYQWKLSIDGGTVYNSIADGTQYNGTNSPDLIVLSAPNTFNGYKYKCEISNTCTSPTLSSAATLSVNTCVTPTAGGLVSGTITVCSGINSTTLNLTGQTGIVLRWQSSTDNFTTSVSDINNATTSLTATNLSATTSYRAVVQSGACAGANSTSATVSALVAPVITSEPVSSQLIATGNIVTLTVTATGSSSYQWTKNNVDITGATTATLSFSPLTADDNGDYRIRVINAGCTTTSNIFQVTPSILLYSKATGNLNIASNWGVNNDGSGSTPVDFTRAEHTFVIANRASAITGGNLAIAGTLDLKDGITVITPSSTLTAGVIKRSGSTGTLSGSSTSSFATTGIDGATNSNLWFEAGSQILKNLTINNVTTTLNTPLSITGGDVANAAGTVTVTNGLLATNGNLTLSSNIYGTARIAPGSAAGGYISGDVTVERYIPNNPNRAWRLLSIPTVGQTIHESWQENQPTNVDAGTGYGTILTSNSGNWQANGYDEKTPGNSLLAYNQATDQLFAVPNTASPIATTGGYFIYIRGNRGVKQSASILSPNSTTLRTKGSIYQGTQNAITIPADKFGLIGNTYPSTIDLRNIITTGGSANTSFSVWDPKLIGSYGLGAYQTFTLDNSNYIVTPGGGSYGASGSINNTIQSGQAFFAEAIGSDGTIQLTEDAKTSGSTSRVFSPPTSSTSKRLIANLYAVTDTTSNLADGTLQLFDDIFDNNVDGLDARKLYNFGENFYITTHKKDLIVEKRKLPAANDTIYFSIETLKRKNYRLDLIASELDNNNLSAWFEDSYTKSSTPLNLSGTTTIKFNVDANAASSVINRFKIVFKQNVVLPVTFTNIKAYQQNSIVAVDWNVTNQLNTNGYEIEKSTNGHDFTKAATLNAATSTGSTISYQWLHLNAMPGDNFYRVISIDKDGSKHYSQVVKVNIATNGGSLSIYPNPVKDGIVKLAFNSMPIGNYTVRLLGNNGALLLSKQLIVAGVNSIQTIQLSNKLPSGNYLFEITHPDKTKSIRQLIIVK